ncbi:TPA: hypothetical protein M9Z22_005239, partial [Klebsiella pneumoniae subsp. pneumoniae]|nr:hypothetical protein [Klebsiella pneumoniae subsp. pneumoniae]
MNRHFHYSVLAAAVLAAIILPAAAQDVSPTPVKDNEVSFDPVFLGTSGNESVDLK